jgi:solute carrier family 13 (sodium-dependent dicarboxylate transporter), member 2/3/5
MFGALPVAILLMLASWWIGGKFMFRMTPKTKPNPRFQGAERKRCRHRIRQDGTHGRYMEKKAGIIFIVVILALGHRPIPHGHVLGFEISLIVTASPWCRAIAFWPKAGIINWNKADVSLAPADLQCGSVCRVVWHSTPQMRHAGWYRWASTELDLVGRQPNFWVVYTIIVAFMAYAGYFFTSKTMRTLIFIPFVVILAQQLGYNPVWIALPGAFTLVLGDWLAVQRKAEPDPLRNRSVLRSGQFLLRVHSQDDRYHTAGDLRNDMVPHHLESLLHSDAVNRPFRRLLSHTKRRFRNAIS